MTIKQTLKNIMYGQVSKTSDSSIQTLKKAIEDLEIEIRQYEKLQEQIVSEPLSLKNMNFEKKRRQTELMEDIPYKDSQLIQDYDHLIMRYNILIELYIKLKNSIDYSQKDLKIGFFKDKYNQPVAVYSHNVPDLHKIILIKNTFFENDYIEYKYISDSEIKLTDAYSQDKNAGHEQIMHDLLEKVIENSSILKITVDKNLLKKVNKNEYEKYLLHHGFVERLEHFTKEKS